MRAATFTIGFVSSTFAPLPGGTETYLDRLSHTLAAQGHDVRVVPRFVETRPHPFERLLATHEPARQYHDDGVQVHVLAPVPERRLLLRPAARLHFYPTTQASAIGLYKAAFYQPLADALDGCEVIHYSGTGRELIGFVAQQIAADTNRPFIVTPHMHVGSWGDSALDLRLYRQADRIIAFTEYEQSAYVEQGIPPNRVHVCGSGLSVSGTGDGARFRREADVGNAPLILFLGRKAKYKGYPMLLRAAPHIWDQHPAAHLVLAGPPDESASLTDSEKRMAADPRILEYGFVSDEMREDLYAACDLFCLPSTDEAFGLVYLEAGSYGKPVVGLDIPTLRELIGQAQSGLLASPSAPSVANAVCWLLDNPDERHRMGKNGQAVARMQTWDHVASTTADLYRRASAATPHPVGA